MATNFSLAVTTAVSIKMDRGSLSPSSLQFLRNPSSPAVLDSQTMPPSGYSGSNDVWFNAMLPAGDYTIANDTGCTKLRIYDAAASADRLPTGFRINGV